MGSPKFILVNSIHQPFDKPSLIRMKNIGIHQSRVFLCFSAVQNGLEKIKNNQPVVAVVVVVWQ